MLARDGIETSDDWIVERTGIRARHFAGAAWRPAIWPCRRRATRSKAGRKPRRST